MYLTNKTFVKSEMKLSALFFENPHLLLMMEHFGLDFIVYDKNVEQVCKENKLSLNVFLTVANLYNGFGIDKSIKISKSDVKAIITFLKNSHTYYKNEKYPEIKDLIVLIAKNNKSVAVNLIVKFFDEYFGEVLDHLDYEDKTAFPYILDLVNKRTQEKDKYSVKTYSSHHTDIETKIKELKNLLLVHLPLKNDCSLRRKLILKLFDLEYDLRIHYLIEESVLIPIISEMEDNNG
jgi:regulator of cell morphogenesis and NO signaling